MRGEGISWTGLRIARSRQEVGPLCCRELHLEVGKVEISASDISTMAECNNGLCLCPTGEQALGWRNWGIFVLLPDSRSRSGSRRGGG